MAAKRRWRSGARQDDLKVLSALVQDAVFR
jgi:hypothetical protein